MAFSEKSFQSVFKDSVFLHTVLSHKDFTRCSGVMRGNNSKKKERQKKKKERKRQRQREQVRFFCSLLAFCKPKYPAKFKEKFKAGDLV